MRGFLIVALTVLAVSHGQASVTCPVGNTPGDILIGNPSDCNSFFLCQNGNPRLFRCPPQLHWSDKLKTCDWPNMSKCVITAPECPSQHGPEEVFLPNPEDCGSFYQCVGGEPHLLVCPPKQHWSVRLKRCEWPENANCKESSSRPTTTTSKPTVTTPKPSLPPPPVCPAEDGPEDILLPNPEDCGSFFKCSKGEPILIACPPFLEWSIALNRCEWPYIAKCPGSSIPEIDPNETECPLVNGEEDVLLPNPEDCGSFFQCDGGIPKLIPCPPNQEFSKELKRCDWPYIAKCSESKSTDEPNPNGCPASNDQKDALLPNPEDCGSFFKCSNGDAHLILCPKNLHWSVKLNRCEWPEVAQCKESKGGAVDFNL